MHHKSHTTTATTAKIKPNWALKIATTIQQLFNNYSTTT